MKLVAHIILGGYRLLLSPIVSALGGGCRFYPTCSEYARVAFATHAWWRALWLVVWRLVRCGPWHPGGPDPVPTSASGVSLRGN